MATTDDSTSTDRQYAAINNDARSFSSSPTPDIMSHADFPPLSPTPSTPPSSLPQTQHVSYSTSPSRTPGQHPYSVSQNAHPQPNASTSSSHSHTNSHSHTSSHSSKGGVDSLDIRATTSGSRGRDGKRTKYRLGVTKCDATVLGSKTVLTPEQLAAVESTHASSSSLSQPSLLCIDDPRASTLKVEYTDGKESATKVSEFHVMPSPERFSAHTGICQILGSKSIRSGRHALAVGDLVRFGSVGLLICDIRCSNEASVEASPPTSAVMTSAVTTTTACGRGPTDGCLTAREMAALISKTVCQDDDASGIDTDDNVDDELATHPLGTTRDNARPLTEGSRHSSLSPRRSMLEERLCYVCYEGDVDASDPLISPCACTGDTKFIHLECLKRWNGGGDAESNVICAIFDEGNPSRACTICKKAYPSSLRLSNKERTTVSLLPDKLPPPYLSFRVVTRHTSSTNMATNTIFQLSVASLLEPSSSVSSLSASSLACLGVASCRTTRPLLVGRSSQCDMVLKYRTVSTIHAEFHYDAGVFSVQDIGSSNGTLRFVYQPLPCLPNVPLHLKFGRTVVSLKAKKRSSLSALFAGFGHHETPASSHTQGSSTNPPSHSSSSSSSSRRRQNSSTSTSSSYPALVITQMMHPNPPHPASSRHATAVYASSQTTPALPPTPVNEAEDGMLLPPSPFVTDS